MARRPLRDVVFGSGARATGDATGGVIAGIGWIGVGMRGSETIGCGVAGVSLIVGGNTAMASPASAALASSAPALGVARVGVGVGGVGWHRKPTGRPWL